MLISTHATFYLSSSRRFEKDARLDNLQGHFRTTGYLMVKGHPRAVACGHHLHHLPLWTWILLRSGHHSILLQLRLCRQARVAL